MGIITSKLEVTNIFLLRPLSLYQIFRCVLQKSFIIDSGDYSMYIVKNKNKENRRKLVVQLVNAWREPLRYSAFLRFGWVVWDQSMTWKTISFICVYIYILFFSGCEFQQVKFDLHQNSTSSGIEIVMDTINVDLTNQKLQNTNILITERTGTTWKMDKITRTR